MVEEPREIIRKLGELSEYEAREIEDALSRHGHLRSPGDGDGADERGDDPVTRVEERRALLGQVAAREAALEGRLSRWAEALRERVFGAPDPPFSDLEEALETWIRPARTGIFIRAPSSEADDRKETLRTLERRVREVEETYGIRLPDPIPQAEILEFPAPEGQRVSTPLDGFGQWRFPVSDTESPHYAVARAVDLFCEWSGYDRGSLTAYVLTGRRPGLPGASLEVRRAWAPDPSGEPGDVDLESVRRHAVLRLNAPPRDSDLRELRRELADLWGGAHDVETQEFVRMVEDELTPEERRGSDSDAWGRAAERWKRFTGAEKYSWQAAYRRYRRNASTKKESEPEQENDR